MNLLKIYKRIQRAFIDIFIKGLKFNDYLLCESTLWNIEDVCDMMKLKRWSEDIVWHISKDI